MRAREEVRESKEEGRWRERACRGVYIGPCPGALSRYIRGQHVRGQQNPASCRHQRISKEEEEETIMVAPVSVVPTAKEATIAESGAGVEEKEEKEEEPAA